MDYESIRAICVTIAVCVIAICATIFGIYKKK